MGEIWDYSILNDIAHTQWGYNSCSAILKINKNWMFHVFSCQVVPALGSRYWYRSWLRCETCQMKLCDQCSWGRSIKDTHSSYSHKLHCCFLVLDFGVSSPPPSTATFKASLEKIAFQQTRPDFFCSMTKWHVEFQDFLSFPLLSSQQSAAHMDMTQVLLAIKCTRPTNIEQHKSQQCWMVKQNFPSRAWSTTF